MDVHNKDVAAIAAHVRVFYDCKEKFHIYHGSTNSTRTTQFDRKKVIDTSRLSRVLKVDHYNKTVLVEPNVPMDRLVEKTMKHGLIPPVVMEFPGITVGGGFAGTAGESSSFKYGFFHCTINWIEMVLANGDIVTASNTERSDLFHGAAGSFGTMGVTTLLELKLIEAQPFVKLTYHPILSVEEGIQKIEEARADSSTDYIDGILFGYDVGVIITGRLTDKTPIENQMQRFSRAKDPWFYLHVKKNLARHHYTSWTEAVPLKDYLFRYDRGGFWTGALAFKYFLTPFNRITRWLLDPLMHTRVMYHALHKSGLSDSYIIQDLAVPYSAAPDLISYIDSTLDIYPLWLCPLLQMDNNNNKNFSMYPHTRTNTPLLNIGVWGPGSSTPLSLKTINRDLEKEVCFLSGIKWLYAQTYYTEAEFWDIYDRKSYDALRAKYHATYLPSVFDKVRMKENEDGKGDSSWRSWVVGNLKEVWPLRGLWGVLMAVMGGEYLLRGKKDA
ncbi:MAG: hypothetical protein M1834_008911 [Cirrosporium novae-zelandiae]|nr:MAG: hypothetical protein M1834_008911 [Cirrosporium novae-zelandiae]